MPRIQAGEALAPVRVLDLSRVRRTHLRAHAGGLRCGRLERDRSGQGQWVHTSLLHAQIAMMDFQAARYLNEGAVPLQAGNDHPSASPMGLYPAQDGSLNIGAAGAGNWRRFCVALERPAWLTDPRFSTDALRIANRIGSLQQESRLSCL